MLAPRDTQTRERRSLDGLWRFALDAKGEGRADDWWSQPLPGPRLMPVPASYNEVYPETEVHDHVGDAWYQIVTRVPERWPGERVVLRFGAATHRAVVWVNGRRFGTRGGYTPFEADVSDVAKPGGEIRITVVVNNTLSWQSIPPGFVEETPEASANATSTTSSTTPACTERCGSTQRPPRTSKTSQSSRTRGLDRNGALRGRNPRRKRRRSGRTLTMPSGTRSRGRPARRASCGSKTRISGARRGLPVRARRSSSGAERGGRRRLLVTGRDSHSARSRQSLPDQQRALLLQGFRQARGQRGTR